MPRSHPTPLLTVVLLASLAGSHAHAVDLDKYRETSNVEDQRLTGDPLTIKEMDDLTPQFIDVGNKAKAKEYVFACDKFQGEAKLYIRFGKELEGKPKVSSLVHSDAYGRVAVDLSTVDSCDGAIIEQLAVANDLTETLRNRYNTFRNTFKEANAQATILKTRAEKIVATAPVLDKSTAAGCKQNVKILIDKLKSYIVDYQAIADYLYGAYERENEFRDKLEERANAINCGVASEPLTIKVKPAKK